MEWLRPLVQTKAWDFCVVWKLGDDPTRYYFSSFFFLHFQTHPLSVFDTHLLFFVGLLNGWVAVVVVVMDLVMSKRKEVWSTI